MSISPCEVRSLTIRLTAGKRCSLLSLPALCLPRICNDEPTAADDDDNCVGNHRTIQGTASIVLRDVCGASPV